MTASSDKSEIREEFVKRVKGSHVADKFKVRLGAVPLTLLTVETNLGGPNRRGW